MSNSERGVAFSAEGFLYVIIINAPVTFACPHCSGAHSIAARDGSGGRSAADKGVLRRACFGGGDVPCQGGHCEYYQLLNTITLEYQLR